MKKEKGITLIALVITIIVLLILAGVTIVTLAGNNGLLQKAGEAKNTNIEVEGLEKIKLAVMASHDENGINTTSLAKNLSQINNLTYTNNEQITENTEITLPIVINLDDNQYIIRKDGNVDKNSSYAIDGLILHLDGIENTRNGHSSTTTTWEDLSGNNNDFTKLASASNAIWSTNSFVGDATNRTLVLNKAILENSNECSVEICYDIPKVKSYYWVFQNRQNGSSKGNGFQFPVSSNGRVVEIFNSKGGLNSSNYINDLKKKTMAFALDTNNVTFSDNGQFYNEDTKEDTIQSVMNRNCYSLGSAYPWQSFNFEGNIYSIRVYNRKLSEEELRNNYEVDRVRFNMN